MFRCRGSRATRQARPRPFSRLARTKRGRCAGRCSGRSYSSSCLLGAIKFELAGSITSRLVLFPVRQKTGKENKGKEADARKGQAKPKENWTYYYFISVRSPPYCLPYRRILLADEIPCRQRLLGQLPRRLGQLRHEGKGLELTDLLDRLLRRRLRLRQKSAQTLAHTASRQIT